MITITLNQIAAHDPCAIGWAKILHARGKIGSEQFGIFLGCNKVPSSYNSLADDEQFPLSIALESNGLDDTLWATRCLPDQYRLWRKYAVWCARQVQHLMTDKRSIEALDVAWRHSCGLATDEELAVAWSYAMSVRGYAAKAAAGAASLSAAMAVQGRASMANAMEKSYDAAWPAVWSAARSVAWSAARNASWASGRRSLWDAQKTKLKQILDAGHWLDDEPIEAAK